MKPFSAGYYIKKNKGRAIIIIFMMLLTTMMYMVGNYIESLWWNWGKGIEYDDKMAIATAVPPNIDEYRDFVNEINADENLIVFGQSGHSFGGELWKTTMGFEMGGTSISFKSVDDMKVVFERLGIKCDYTNLKNHSVVMSRMFADNLNKNIGDTFKDGLFTLDALIDDDSFVFFYIYEEPDPDDWYNMMIMSDTMSGDELRNYVRNIIGDRNIAVGDGVKHGLEGPLGSVKYIFYAVVAIISIMIAVTLNSVITGQYIKRNYEFAIYGAIGISKKMIRRKVAKELLTMDFIAIVIGTIVIFFASFILNEMLYKPKGMYLPYFSIIGVIGVIIGNVLVVGPLIFFKGRKMCKIDVTEF
ncbi:FtsX-like permease family protein [Eubacterium ruminantium]|uniref:FtsX-like permease family protein n=1 Tax=Eubacterium ruminantium TaxID=42322 RepID=UPI001567D282|nr:ABC transporter permease [Eubacterium ruminantium]